VGVDRHQDRRGALFDGRESGTDPRDRATHLVTADGAELIGGVEWLTGLPRTTAGPVGGATRRLTA
jgi:hypothetical protein